MIYIHLAEASPITALLGIFKPDLEEKQSFLLDGGTEGTYIPGPATPNAEEARGQDLMEPVLERSREEERRTKQPSYFPSCRSVGKQFFLWPKLVRVGFLSFTTGSTLANNRKRGRAS